MKNLCLIITLLVLGSTTMNAQGLINIGAGAGIPIGDAGDFSDFAIAVDVSYLFNVSEKFNAGATVGYSHSFGKDFDAGQFTVEADDVQFIPIAASGRFEVVPELLLGADLGYAIGINDGQDGGFYYSPRAQYGISEAIDIVLAYRGVAIDGGSWDIISAGVEFGID